MNRDELIRRLQDEDRLFTIDQIGDDIVVEEISKGLKIEDLALDLETEPVMGILEARVEGKAYNVTSVHQYKQKVTICVTPKIVSNDLYKLLRYKHHNSCTLVVVDPYEDNRRFDVVEVDGTKLILRDTPKVN